MVSSFDIMTTWPYPTRYGKFKNPGHVQYLNVDLGVELNYFSGSSSATNCKHLKQLEF